MPLEQVEGKEVETIEGLAPDGELHPVQQAFVDVEALQCGYCVPGMIMSTVAFLRRKGVPTKGDVLAELNGHLCRCCGYSRIKDAVFTAAKLAREKR
jgi:aerobic-type carbon monoxide dehydrogenase small subunit (CoxS/CutS family)